jgi:type III pantothenate kinase
MNLIVDAGNTQIKWSLFQNSELIEKNSCQSWEEFANASWKNSLSIIQSCIVSSTRKPWSEFQAILEGKSIAFYALKHDLPLPISLDYKTPKTLGLDRIAAAAGAWATFPGEPILIIDMGTAITFDFLSSEGSFRGGNISPGLDIRFQSLNRFTDNLPLAGYNEEASFFGQSTLEAIESGVQTGIYYEVIGYINALKDKYNGLKIILTGGSAEYFVRKLKKTIFVDPNLVLKGLNHILEHQKRSKTGR